MPSTRISKLLMRYNEQNPEPEPQVATMPGEMSPPEMARAAVMPRVMDDMAPPMQAAPSEVLLKPAVMPGTVQAAVMPPTNVGGIFAPPPSVAPAVTGAKVMAPPTGGAAMGQVRAGVPGQMRAAVMPTGSAMAKGFGAMRGANRAMFFRGRAARSAGPSPVQQGMADSGQSGLMVKPNVLA